nr:cytochrome c peroxidase [uncultured Flavobacterium sp.]
MKYIVFVFFLLLMSCQSEEEQYAYIPASVALQTPLNFPNTTYNFDSNPLTEKGIELGKKLFYDGNLSADGIVSCGFCHVQSYGFTHHGHTVSHGVFDRIGTRNTPALQNLAFQNSFMWDGVSHNLDLNSIIPITAEVEMDANFNDINSYLQAKPSYVNLFKQAFPSGEISTENVLKALSQFMLTFVSANSKYDKVIRNEAENFTNDEQQGYVIFQQKCASCHATELFSDQTFRNNGLPINPNVNDEGRFKVTELNTDRYKFKVPSLRNIAVTAPYMHDGRFLNLDAVLEFYNSGVQNTTNLDPLLISSTGRLGISLFIDEKQKLKAFLNTLTDSDFLSNPKLSEF